MSEEGGTPCQNRYSLQPMKESMMEQMTVSQGNDTHGETTLEKVFLTGLQLVEEHTVEQMGIPEGLQPVEEPYQSMGKV